MKISNFLSVVVLAISVNSVGADHFSAVMEPVVLLKGPPIGIPAGLRRKRDTDPAPSETTLTNINYSRRQAANIGKIANMWALKWSDELEKKAKEMPTECEKIRLGDDYRFFMTAGDSVTLMYEVSLFHGIRSDPSDPTTKAMMETMEKEGGSPLEAMHPLQTRVGCIPYECRRTVYSEYHEETMDLHYSVLCLTGPYGKEAPTGIVQIGPPGSECGSGSNDGGLCV